MRVCLRRAGNKEGEPILTCGGLQLNLLEHRVVVEGREVKLTPTEYELLKVMLKYAGRVLTHKQLLKAVWGNEYDTDTHYIRIYMRQLRRKIEPDPAQPKYLITEAGIGYRCWAANKFQIEKRTISLRNSPFVLIILFLFKIIVR